MARCQLNLIVPLIEIILHNNQIINRHKLNNSTIRKRKHHDISASDNDELQPSTKRIKTVPSRQIKNALVILICIGDYSKRSGVDSLIGTVQDEKKMKKLFGQYGFTVISPQTSQNQTHGKQINQAEFMGFLKHDVTKELKNNGANYDAIMFIAAGHGRACKNGALDRLYFSDQFAKYINIRDIKEYINSRVSPNVAKIYLWDICRTYAKFGDGTSLRSINSNCPSINQDPSIDKGCAFYINTLELFATIQGGWTEESDDDGGELIGALYDLLNENHVNAWDLIELGEAIKNRILLKSKQNNCPESKATGFLNSFKIVTTNNLIDDNQ